LYGADYDLLKVRAYLKFLAHTFTGPDDQIQVGAFTPPFTSQGSGRTAVYNPFLNRIYYGAYPFPADKLLVGIDCDTSMPFQYAHSLSPPWGTSMYAMGYSPTDNTIYTAPNTISVGHGFWMMDGSTQICAFVDGKFGSRLLLRHGVLAR
jgi:hypothetical protein